MGTIFFAIVKLFLITFMGFCLYEKKILKDDTLNFLTIFVVNLAIPFLIFTNIIDNFIPGKTPSVLLFGGLSILIFLLGLLLGALFSFSVSKTIRREFISLVSFQNSGYLPMNIAFFLLPLGIREKFFVYIFLYLVGFNILMWSVGSFFIFKKQKEEFNTKSLFTPPILSTFLALAVVYSGVRSFMPDFIITPAKMVGNTSFVLSMVILGGYLAKAKLKKYLRTELIVKIAGLKLIILPLIIFLGILAREIYSLLGLFILLEASMPSAASLPIVTNIRKADSEFVSCGVFFTHLISIVTVPLWIGLFFIISGFSF